MPRPPSVSGGRPVVVHVRYSEAEIAAIDRARGRLSRSAYVRLRTVPDPSQVPQVRDGRLVRVEGSSVD